MTASCFSILEMLFTHASVCLLVRLPIPLNNIGHHRMGKETPKVANVTWLDFTMLPHTHNTKRLVCQDCIIESLPYYRYRIKMMHI